MMAFETAMVDQTIFEPHEDEMAVDAAKYQHATEDIDIDLDFEDHVNQDEMMVEDNTVIDYDLELDDAVATAEQDAEMTDESSEDFMIDEDITDAPSEFQAAAAAAAANYTHGSIPGADQDLATAQPGDSIATIVEHADASTGHNLGLEQAQPESVTIDESRHDIPTGEATVQDMSDSAPQVEESILAKETPKTKEEENELDYITWESDEEEDLDDSKVGEVKDDSTVSNPAQPQGGPATLEDEKESTANVEDGKTEGVAQDNVEEAATSDEPKPSTHGGITYEDETEADLGEGTGVDEEAEVVDGEHTEDHTLTGVEEPLTIPEGFQQLTIEMLPSIVIHYMDNELSLFPPLDAETGGLYFLKEHKLAFASCEALFKAFREVLGSNIADHEALVLECPDLQLEIHEDTPECSTLTVAHLLDLYVGLSKNDGHEEASPFTLVLRHYQDVSARLNHLYTLLQEQKGLSHAIAKGIEHVDASDTADIVQSNDGAVNDAEAEVEAVAELLASDEAEVHEPSTPKPQDYLGVVDNEPDFRSPATVQKHTDMLRRSSDVVSHEPVQSINESIIGEAETGNGEEADHHGNEEITYDDEEEEARPDIVNGHAHSIDADASSLHVTNLDTNKEANSNGITNNSATNGTGHESILDLEAEDDEFDFGLEDTLVRPAADKDKATAPSESKIQETSTGNNETTASDVVPSIETTTSTAVDDIDEIDYSDEDEPAPPVIPLAPEITTKKAQSPKRSIVEADESPRDVKKLRSG